jgi:hypothetical protein
MTRSHAILVSVAIGALALISAGPPDLPPCARGAFAGITETLPDGTIQGQPDPRDWGCAGHGGGAGAGGGQALVLGVPVGPPVTLCFLPAAPNPATFQTQLGFALPSAGPVRLVIYGRSQGQGPPETVVVRTLVDASLAVGLYTNLWDLNDDHGARVAPGIYRAVLVAGDQALCGDIEVQ